MTPKYVYPLVRTATSGLVCRRASYFARYYRDGKLLQHRLDTTDPDLARKRRDAFYRSLAKQGGVPTGMSPGRPRILPPGKKLDLPEGVAYRKPWTVTYNGKSLGRFHKLADALKAWDEANS